MISELAVWKSKEPFKREKILDHPEFMTPKLIDSLKLLVSQLFIYHYWNWLRTVYSWNPWNCLPLESLHCFFCAFPLPELEEIVVFLPCCYRWRDVVLICCSLNYRTAGYHDWPDVAEDDLPEVSKGTPCNQPGIKLITYLLRSTCHRPQLDILSVFLQRDLNSSWNISSSL